MCYPFIFSGCHFSFNFVLFTHKHIQSVLPVTLSHAPFVLRYSFMGDNLIGNAAYRGHLSVLEHALLL